MVGVYHIHFHICVRRKYLTGICAVRWNVMAMRLMRKSVVRHCVLVKTVPRTYWGNNFCIIQRKLFRRQKYDFSQIRSLMCDPKKRFASYKLIYESRDTKNNFWIWHRHLLLPTIDSISFSLWAGTYKNHHIMFLVSHGVTRQINTRKGSA